MKSRGVDQKQSETALFTALRRTIAHLEYSNDRLGPDFLAERGLGLLSHLENEEIEQKYLLDERGNLIGRITGIFRFALASPLRQNH